MHESPRRAQTVSSLPLQMSEWIFLFKNWMLQILGLDGQGVRGVEIQPSGQATIATALWAARLGVMSYSVKPLSSQSQPTVPCAASNYASVACA